MNRPERWLRVLRDLPRLLAVWVSLAWFDRRLRRHRARLDLHVTETPRARRTLPAAAIDRWRWRVDVAARCHPRPMPCLVRSLCLRHWLARHGQDADLRIGVRRPESHLEAHAWLEIEGQPVTGPFPSADATEKTFAALGGSW
jgi:hypothetical protein